MNQVVVDPLFSHQLSNIHTFCEISLVNSIVSFPPSTITPAQYDGFTSKLLEFES